MTLIWLLAVACGLCELVQQFSLAIT